MLRITWVLIGAAAVALGAGFFWFSQRVTDTGIKSPGFTLRETDRTIGNPHAPVTLIEYGAPSCGVCAAFSLEVFPKVKRDYIDTGKVYYVFRVFPLDVLDVHVEKMARCLPRDQYFSFLELTWRNQQMWDKMEYKNISDPNAALVRLGNRAGMRTDQIERCISSTEEDKRINMVAAEAEERYRTSRTPTFIVDGVIKVGGRRYGPLAKALDSEIIRKTQKG